MQSRNLEDLSRQGPDFLLDTAAINAKRLAAVQTALHWQTGTFQVPKGVSQQVFERLKRVAALRYIDMMSKRGWTLQSKLYLDGPHRAYDIRDAVVLLDKDEYRIRAQFRKENPKYIRTEVPRELVKQDPEHRLTVKDAMKIDGIAPRGG